MRRRIARYLLAALAAMAAVATLQAQGGTALEKEGGIVAKRELLALSRHRAHWREHASGGATVSQTLTGIPLMDSRKDSP